MLPISSNRQPRWSGSGSMFNVLPFHVPRSTVPRSTVPRSTFQRLWRLRNTSGMRSCRGAEALGYGMQSPPVRAMADYFLKDHQRSTFNDKPSTFNPRFACFHARLPDAIKRERPRSQVVICQVADRIRKPSVKKISERYVQHSNLQPSTFNLPRPNVPTFHVPTFNVQRSTFQRSTFHAPTFNLQRSSSRSVQIAQAESAYATSDAASTGVKP